MTARSLRIQIEKIAQDAGAEQVGVALHDYETHRPEVPAEQEKRHDRPAKPKKSPAPLFHAASKKVRLELYRAYGKFLGAFRTAAEKLRAGMRDVVFPAGSFPPALPWVSG